MYGVVFHLLTMACGLLYFFCTAEPDLFFITEGKYVLCKPWADCLAVNKNKWKEQAAKGGNCFLQQVVLNQGALSPEHLSLTTVFV